LEKSIGIWKIAMVEIQEEKRSRGRPQVRSDDETRAVVTNAASLKFQSMGFAAACVSDIAQEAGISTKTLYRLFPAKADLFESVVADRIDRFTLEADETHPPVSDIVSSLAHLLIAYGRLTLDPETIAINRLVVAEAERFPEIAATFYRRAILGTARVVEAWLLVRQRSGEIDIDDVYAAGGMLRGMMTMEPQRAAMLGQRPPPSDDEIKVRALMCARLFLNGCLRQKAKEPI
jgi:AcrR family transcriptional regulator